MWKKSIELSGFFHILCIILVHNHPSGDATPSKEDIALTREIIQAAALFHIRVHDHIIIGAGGSHLSLRADGVIDD